MTTVKKITRRIKSDTPLWFRKLKKAVALTSDTAIVILLATGHSEDSLAMVIVRVGLSYAMNLGEIFVEPKE
jgi:hypothetical protein